jgi:hypothetical protein
MAHVPSFLPVDGLVDLLLLLLNSRFFLVELVRVFEVPEIMV